MGKMIEAIIFSPQKRGQYQMDTLLKLTGYLRKN
jgi:hypothetical protein